MIIIHNYFVAISLTIVAMIAWGSWANTQKIAEKKWRFELYYWDMVIGIVLMALIGAFTIGSLGSEGRTFLTDIKQASGESILQAMLGGVLWNTGNLLLVAAIATAGISVAFPIGGGIAWVVGIIFNYIVILMDHKVPSEKPLLLWIGVVVIAIAILLNGTAYKRLSRERKKPSLRGILLSVSGGLFIAFFYGFVAKSLDGAFVAGGTGNLTPSTAIVFFTMGVILCTIIFFLFFMKPLKVGVPGTFREYFGGGFRNHTAGVLGGMIWALGMVASFMAIGAANPAIAYALSNAAPVVAVLWGLFVWKEFRGAPRGTNGLLLGMFLLYLAGLVLITASNA
ncbi:MAG: GRP family sugar transporter [Bacteroidota bacterium]